MALFCFASIFLGMSASEKAGAETYDLIIGGLGGEARFSEAFADWGVRLSRVLGEQLGHNPDNISLFLEKADEASGANHSSLENILATLADLRTKITSDDDLYIYMIGHGTYLRGISNFNIPGKDLTAAGLKEELDLISARRIVIINSTPSSAGFINQLSGPNRIVASATKSERERNATQYMEFFIVGLEESSADQNRDERISILEACQQATSLTQAWYLAEGLISTEHALIDDNGDGLGSRLPLDTEYDLESDDPFILTIDGAIASTCYIKDFIFPPTVPAELVETYMTALEQIDILKRTKSNLDPTSYYDQLEALIIEAATANKSIREIMGRIDG